MDKSKIHHVSKNDMDNWNGKATLEDLSEYLSSEDGAITTDKIADNSVTADKIAGIARLGDAIAIGNQVEVPVVNARGIAIGLQAKTLAGGSGISIGAQAEVQGGNGAGIAIGNQTKVLNGFGTAIGLLCSANSGTAVGDRSHAFHRSVALGNPAQASVSDSIAIGWDSQVTHIHSCVLGDMTRSTSGNQILLGRSRHTPFAYRALSVISDQRDKADISPLKYDPLKFINKIEPKQYKLDFRSDYTRLEEVTEKEYEELDDYTKQHRVREIPVYSIDNEVEFIDYPFYEEVDDTRSTEDKFKTLIKSKVLKSREEAVAKYKDMQLSKRNNMENLTDELIKDLTDGSIEEKIIKVRYMKLARVQLPKDGSKTNNRYHNGVLAQQVKAVADEMGFDFCGFKDHSVNGGDDLYSISYEEFIAPMIGAIQQLTKRLEIQNNKIQELEDKLNNQ